MLIGEKGSCYLWKKFKGSLLTAEEKGKIKLVKKVYFLTKIGEKVKNNWWKKRKLLTGEAKSKEAC